MIMIIVSRIELIFVVETDMDQRLGSDYGNCCRLRCTYVCILGGYIFGRLLIFKLPWRLKVWKSVNLNFCEKFLKCFNILKFSREAKVFGRSRDHLKSQNRHSLRTTCARDIILVSKVP